MFLPVVSPLFLSGKRASLCLEPAALRLALFERVAELPVTHPDPSQAHATGKASPSLWDTVVCQRTSGAKAPRAGSPNTDVLCNNLHFLCAKSSSNGRNLASDCLLLWRYSRPAWTRSSTAYCR